jgi:hypothetical protein
MFTNLSQDEIITSRHKRNYVQWGGARPNNPVAYSGQDAQYMVIDGLSMSEVGGVSPIWVPDTRVPGRYRLAGRSLTPADLSTISVKIKEKHALIPRALTYIGCPVNFYEASGACADLSDFLRGWTDYVMVYAGGIVTKKDGGARSTWDSDDPMEDSLEITLSDAYPVGGLSFGEIAAQEIDREVVDVVYQSLLNCGDCGPYTDGLSRIYCVTKSSGAGSPGLPGELVYTLDGGATMFQTTITGMGATEDPVGIDIVNNYLVVLAGTSAAPAYYYAEISKYTGVPGTFSKVTNGLITAKQPKDIFVLSPREVWLVGDAGSIYKSTDITAGATLVNVGLTSNNLERIHGRDDTMLAVGQGGVIVRTINRGKTWGTITTTPTISSIKAVTVLDQFRYWIGHSAGRIYSTIDNGETWQELAYGDAGTGVVYDIVFPTAEVGFVLYTNATPTAKILTTWDGGRSWTTTDRRIMNLPTFSRPNRLAYPRMDSAAAVNNVCVAGLSGGGTDGILVLGIAARL